jgi:hypothetical protein
MELMENYLIKIAVPMEMVELAIIGPKGITLMELNSSNPLWMLLEGKSSDVIHFKAFRLCMDSEEGLVQEWAL